MLAMDEHVQMMNIEERRVVAEPTEVLEDIPLEEGILLEVYLNWNKYEGEDEARPCPILKEEH